MCKRLMLVILVLGVLFAPAIAFADDGFEGSGGGDFSDRVIYGPNVLNIQSGTYGVQVYAGNKFNAALCVLGFDGNDSRFTNDVKAYLSNESSGGSFYEFSNLFTNNNDPSFSGLDAYNITFNSAIGTSNTLYGAEFVWIAKYTDALRQSAYARVEEVLDGNIGGGNSPSVPPSGEDNDYIYFSGNLHYGSWSGADDYYIQGQDGKLYGFRVYGQFVTDHYEYFPGDGSTSTSLLPASSPMILKVDKRLFNTLPDNLSDVIARVEYYTNNINVCFYSGTTTQTETNDKYGTDEYIKRGSATSYTNDLYFSKDGGTTFTYDGKTLTISFVSGGKYSWRNGNVNFLQTTNNALLPFGSGSGLEPVVPPTNWPDPDPVTPTEPPEVPDPPSSDPVSEPTNVNIGIPQLPNIGLTTEPTYQTADLAAVLDAMAKHCQHLQTCMTECFDSYYSSITQFEKSLQENTKEFQRSWFRVTLDTIRDCFDDLSDYLQRLFTWLADQMDFTFTGGDFDDSSIVWWLKKIYSKLGSGTTVRPTDPVVDPKGIGDWFDQLIKNFVLDLLALGQDFLADVVEMFRQLTTKFPISIPWDILAILTLFAAEPETPVLNIPQYALTGVNTISQVGTYVIDMQDYDGVMSVVRNVEKVVFAFWLCWKIDFFKQAFDIMTGGK